MSRPWRLDHLRRIKENMVFALEIYNGPKDGKYGVCIEEEMVVTSTGAKVITKFPVDELVGLSHLAN